MFQPGAKYVPVFVCALKLGTDGEICAGRCPKLPEQVELASVIAPSAKNLLPDEDAFLGATGRILRGLGFVLLDPSATQLCSRSGLWGWQLGKELARGQRGTRCGFTSLFLARSRARGFWGTRDRTVPCTCCSFLLSCSCQSMVVLRTVTLA